MGKFKDSLINEKVKYDKVYIDSYNTLWVTYSSGSGRTIPNISNKSYMTNKAGDKNYNSASDIIFEWSQQNKPLKKAGNSKLFELGVYDRYKDPYKGDSPSKKFYMVVDKNEKGLVVITFFKTKNESMNWIKSIGK